MNDRAELTVRCRLLASQGCERETLVSFLREQGCSKIDSIVVLRTALGIDLGQAKELVHLSKAWRDLREIDDRMHEQLEKALEEDSLK